MIFDELITVLHYHGIVGCSVHLLLKYDSLFADGTLDTWPDPCDAFAKLQGKKGIVLNNNPAERIEAFDCSGRKVHPSALSTTFRPGIIVEADVELNL